MNKRCANFTDYEKELLINIVMEYRHIIENKKTNATTWKEKNEAWAKIERDFNGNGTVVRSAKTLKLKYENIKKEIRKVCANQRRDSLRTGGGAPQARELLPFEEKVLAVSEMSATGLGPSYDNDVMNATSLMSETNTVSKEMNVEYLENDDMKMYMAALQKQKPIISNIQEKNIELNSQDIVDPSQIPENQNEACMTDEWLIEHNTAGPSDHTRKNQTEPRVTGNCLRKQNKAGPPKKYKLLKLKEEFVQLQMKVLLEETDSKKEIDELQKQALIEERESKKELEELQKKAWLEERASKKFIKELTIRNLKADLELKNRKIQQLQNDDSFSYK